MALGNNFNWSGAAQYLDLDPSWYEDESQLRDDIQGRWDKATPAQRQNFSKNLASQHRPQARSISRGNPMYNDLGANYALGMHQAQGNALQGMANDVMSAIRRENDSRVAQERERRRMEHEQMLGQQQMNLAQAQLDNQRQRDQQDAANQIRQLRFLQAKDTGFSGPREYRQDPMTGNFRWFESWE